MNKKALKYQFSAGDSETIICKDHLVTGDKFSIVNNGNGILATTPVPENLGKYYNSEAYISHKDASGNLFDRIYHGVKSYMLSKKTGWITEYYKTGSILDYGAGTGEFLIHMQKAQWQVAGVEPNEKARGLGISKGVDLREDISEVETRNFDVISLWHVLEHIPDLDSKISGFKNLLDDEGVLIVAVPNHNSYDAKYYKEDWAAWDVPRHLWHFSRSGIESKFSQFGFKLIEEKPLLFDSYYVSMLSEKNGKEGSMLNALYRGFLSNLQARNNGEYSSIAYFFKKQL